jgi:DNA-directed RNA polymerase specialized sigma24 family protein
MKPVTPWPDVTQSWMDQYGAIDADVYGVAAELWPRAERMIGQYQQDASLGQQLMMKACALVTHRRTESEITNLTAYLFQTWKHLFFAELEKNNGHRRLEETLAPPDPPATADVERQILLQQIEQMMDADTRRIFHWLCLGHTYEEIGAFLGMRAESARNKYNRQVHRLIERFKSSS